MGNKDEKRVLRMVLNMFFGVLIGIACMSIHLVLEYGYSVSSGIEIEQLTKEKLELEVKILKGDCAGN